LKKLIQARTYVTKTDALNLNFNSERSIELRPDLQKQSRHFLGRDRETSAEISHPLILQDRPVLPRYLNKIPFRDNSSPNVISQSISFVTSILLCKHINLHYFAIVTVIVPGQTINSNSSPGSSGHRSGCRFSTVYRHQQSNSS